MAKVHPNLVMFNYDFTSMNELDVWEQGEYKSIMEVRIPQKFQSNETKGVYYLRGRFRMR